MTHYTLCEEKNTEEAIYLPLSVFAMLFAISREQRTTLSLWPCIATDIFCRAVQHHVIIAGLWVHRCTLSIISIDFRKLQRYLQ